MAVMSIYQRANMIIEQPQDGSLTKRTFSCAPAQLVSKTSKGPPEPEKNSEDSHTQQCSTDGFSRPQCEQLLFWLHALGTKPSCTRKVEITVSCPCGRKGPRVPLSAELLVISPQRSAPNCKSPGTCSRSGRPWPEEKRQDPKPCHPQASEHPCSRCS